MQVNEYVEREILNHRSLQHPHIIAFKEVRVAAVAARRPPTRPLVLLNDCSASPAGCLSHVRGLARRTVLLSSPDTLAACQTPSSELHR